MSRRITIDPITRLEGHGKIEILLDADGCVERTFFQVPDFKGFEKFCEGRPAEEMPTLTQKICGVCPTAHHMASSKALDALFGIEPTKTAVKVRELVHNAFVFEDHLLHFYFLGGPDFLAGPDASRSKRNFFGVAQEIGVETAKRVIDVRKRVRQMNASVSGSALYPVFGLPGGISKTVTRGQAADIQKTAEEAVEMAKLSLSLFHEKVLRNSRYAGLFTDDAFCHRTYYMGLVDEAGRVNFYDGTIRVIDPDGNEYAVFKPKDFAEHLEEQVVPWSYAKILYLRNVGWRGLVDGNESGVYRVGPLARLNVSTEMATASAQTEYETMFDALGGKPVHHTMAYHWARLIEALYAAERMVELSRDEDLFHSDVRHIPEQVPIEGVGVCEAPRGTLFHHYRTNEQAIVEELNLLVATQNNAAAISMSIEKAAKAFIKGHHISEGKLNRIEMAFRAYDPCLACATH